MPIAIAIVGDLFTPRERGKWQGITGAVWGLSAIVGPTAGGWITENTSWRWVFYVNVPVGIAAMLVLIFLMPTLQGKVKEVSIDYVGSALLVAGTVPLLLGFTWAGTLYDWLSPQIIGTFAVSLVFLVAFVAYEVRLERRGGQPIIEPSLFKNSIFVVSTLITTVFGMALFGSIFFIPLFVQGVIGTSATDSGLILTPLMLTSIVGSVFSGQLVSRLGKYKWIAIVGMIISVVGTYLLVLMDVNSTNNTVLLAMLVLGLGMGFSMSLYNLVVQNAIPRKIGQATSALIFFRSIGGTIALAAMGSVMSAAYLPGFHSTLSATAKQPIPAKIVSFFDNPQILLSPDAQTQMQHNLQGTGLYNVLIGAVKAGLTQGIHNVFILSLAIMLVGMVAVFFLKEIPLIGGRAKKNGNAATGEEVELERMSPVMLH